MTLFCIWIGGMIPWVICVRWWELGCCNFDNGDAGVYLYCLYLPGTCIWPLSILLVLLMVCAAAIDRKMRGSAIRCRSRRMSREDWEREVRAELAEMEEGVGMIPKERADEIADAIRAVEDVVAKVRREYDAHDKTAREEEQVAGTEQEGSW